MEEDGSAVRAPDLALVFAPGRQPRIEPGWVAPEYGVKLPAPVVSVVADGDADVEFLTLVVPADSDAPLPTLRVWRGAGDGSRLTVAEVGGAGPGRPRPRRLEPDGRGVRAGTASIRAAAAWLRQSATGDCLSLRVCEATSVTNLNGETPTFTTDAAPSEWLAWDLDRGLDWWPREDR